MISLNGDHIETVGLEVNDPGFERPGARTPLSDGGIRAMIKIADR